MKQGKLAGTQSTHCNPGGFHRRRLDALARTALVVAIGLGLPAAALAQSGVQADAHASQRPGVHDAANGTPVVNIVAPDKHGLSHNRYTRFNVGKKGLILNNSKGISRTKLAGYVYGNANLQASGPASVILNEVTSTHKSILQGYMEVAGTPAAVIVANPNGISCDGCGFINTPRATLTTGEPVFGGDGSLSGFRVTRGAIDVGGAGLDGSHVDRVDLLARAIDINAKLWANHLDVVAGASRIDYADLSAQAIGGSGDKPEVSIDVAALGGMYAGVIHLVGTEAGVGVNIQGETAAQAGDFTLTSAGKVVLGGKATATGSVTVGSLRSVDVDGVLASGGAMSVHGRDLDLAGTVYSDKGINLVADGDIHNQGKVQAHGGALRVRAGGGVSNAAGSVFYAGDGIAIDAATLANHGKLYALGGAWRAHVDGNVVNAADGDIYAAGGVTLHAGDLAQHGRVEAGQALAVTASGTLANDGIMQADESALTLRGYRIDNSGTLSAAGDMVVRADTMLVTTGKLLAVDHVTLQGENIAASGSVKGGKALTLASTGDATVGGKLYALDGPLELDVSGTLANLAGGDIYARQAVIAKVGTLANAGQLYGADALDIHSSAGIANSGRIQSGGALSLQIAGDVENHADGVIHASDGATFDIGATLHNVGTIYAGKDLDASIVTLHNAGTAYAVGNADWRVGGTLTNLGVLAAAGDTRIAAGALQGSGTLAAGLDDTGKLGARGDLDIQATHVLQAGGRNLAAGSMNLSGAAIDLAHSQTWAAGDANLAAAAGDISLRGATLGAGGTARFTATGALLNGGKARADSGVLTADTLLLDVAGIDNRYGTLKQNGKTDLAIDLDGAFRNAHGLLAVNAGNLLVQAASLGNAAGSIQHAGSGMLTLVSAGTLDNAGGVIAGNGGLAIQSGKVFDNAGGTVGVLNDATVDAASLDNRGGSLAAHAVTMKITGGVDNTGGTLQSTGAFNLHAHSLTNAGTGKIKVTGSKALGIVLDGSLVNAGNAFIGGNGAVALQTGALANAGQVYAGTNLEVTAGNVDNDHGALQAMGSLALDSTAALHNAAGRIEAGAGQSTATMRIQARTLDNRGGRLANIGTGDTRITIVGDIDNQNGTLGGKGDVTLGADRVDNSGKKGKIVATGNLVLKLARLDNTGGTVYAARDLTWHRAGASLVNAAGADFGSGRDLALTLHDVDNASGNLDAGHDLILDLAAFSGSGRVVAGRNLVLALPGDYTNGQGNILKANGNVTLDLGGDFINPAKAKLLAVGKLTVHAARISNAKNAVINSGTTVLAADGSLSNKGDIQGNDIRLTADTITNTGNIIGGYITAHADDLTNGESLGHTIRENHYQTALIAATRGLDLYVTGTLLNQDAHMFTLGDMTLAANARGDRADAIINRSGLIEADGNLYAAADQITNKRRYYQFKTFEVSGTTVVGWDGVNGQSGGGTLLAATPRMRLMMLPPVDPGGPGYPGPGGGTPSVSKTVVQRFHKAAQAGPAAQGYCSGGSPAAGWFCYEDADSRYWIKQTDTWTVTSATVLTAVSAEGRMLVGGNVVLDGSLLNDASTVSAGGNLRINGVARSGSVDKDGACHDGICNIGHAPTLGFAHRREVRVWVKQWSNGGVFHDGDWDLQEDDPQVMIRHDDNAPPDGDTRWVTAAGLDIGPSLSAHLTAGGDVSIDAGNIHNTVVDPEGNPVHGATGLGANHAGRPVSDTDANQVGRVSGSVGTGGNVALGGASGGHGGKVDVPGGSGHGVDLAPPQTIGDAAITLPHSGLYTVNDDPDSSYLVETDPRFADYANFISSDYLLDKLGYDPADMDKRLGDGFYEQRQVLDQITTLTGRRYLSSHMDALSQYRALMNNATIAARKFDFEVGVALTGEQMAALTHDIVWLVEEKVDGQAVLVPVVYLSRASANQLGQPGAVIAGRNVMLDASGDISSNGRIAARRDATLKADNLLNSGLVRAGGDLGIQAARDILNQGGVMRGTNVTLAAGGDVVSRVDIGPVHLAGVNLGDLDAGGISADRNLKIAAGRDITLGQVNIHAGRDLKFVAGRDLAATATSLHAGHDVGVLAGRDIAFKAKVDRQHHFGHDTAVASSMHRGVALEAGNHVLVKAGRDITAKGAGLKAGGDLGMLAGRDIQLGAGKDYVSRYHDGVLAAGTTRHGTQLDAGNDLMLTAGRDVAAAAANVQAGGNVGVLAGRDVTLDAAASHRSEVHDRNDYKAASTIHQVTTLKAGGNLDIAAGRDLASHGATLDAGKRLGIAAGRDIRLAAVTDHKHTDSHGWHGDTRFHKVTDDDTLRATQLQAGNGINVSAGHDATLVATQIASDHGNVALAAGHDLTLAAGHENHKTVVDTYHHDSGFLSSSTTTTHDVGDNDIAIVTGIKGKQVSLMAGHDLASHGASVQAGKALVLGASHDVTLGAADNTYRSQHHRHHEDSGFGIGTLTGTFDDGLYTKNTDDQQDMVVDHVATGTLLSGDTIRVTAGHDLTTIGAQVAATRQLVMAAGHDLVIDAAANTHGGRHQHTHRVDGWQRNGLVNMVGTTKSRQRAKGDEVSYVGSLIGSTRGEVALIAGHNVHITGSDVISQTGTTITGQNVTIDAALGSTDGRREFSMHRAGIMGGIGGQIGNLANSAYGAYRTAKRGGRSEDSRLKALYAAKAGYQSYDAYRGMRGVSASGVSGGIGTEYQTDKTGKKTIKAGTGTGISVKISLGASTANSHADTHDDMAYGSHIKSQGDVTIAATNGDLDIIGSQIKGQNVALAASHDLNLLSQVEQHTQKQSGAHAGGQIGVSIGQTTGIFLSVNGGKARAHGNGTTHALTTVDAVDTLSLVAGHDATLRGAQARGNTILADIGHNLTLESEQDTGDFASKQWEAGLTLVYGWSSGSVGVSGHASAAGMKHHYKSVTQVTGLAAGDGGFQIHVGGNTDLTGAVIASTADPYKNWLDTGSLSWSDIHNEAKYSSWSVSVGAGAGASPVGQSMAGLSGGIGIPQSHDQSSTTEAGIAPGAITVRHGNTSLAGLNRNPDIDAKGLTNRFDRKELAEQQEMGRVAGYVGMRTVGMIAEHEQKLAARDLANATTDEDAAEAQARLDRWSTGGTYKDILHGMVGAATAALGGGNALNGALGATASEMASGQMEQYLVAHHINPNSPKGRSLMELASTAIGAAAGGGAGAATALQGEKYNRQLHVDTIDYITKRLAAKFAEAHDMTVPEAQRILLRQAMRMTDDYNDRFLSMTDSPKMQAAAKAFLTGHNPVGVDGYLYDLFPSAEDKANSKMGAYDLVKNKAAYGAVLDALATGMMKKNGQASMKDYQTDMWALDGRYRDRGTGLAWDEAWRHHVNQEDLAFLKLYGETALAGATAGIGAEFAVLGGALSGGVSGYMSNGWKGAMVGAVVGGTIGKVAPGLTYRLFPIETEGRVGGMLGRTAVFSGINGLGSGAGTVATNAWTGKEWSDGVMPSIAIGVFTPVASGESFFWGAGGDLVFGAKAADGFGWATGVLGVGAAGVDPNSKHGFRGSSPATQMKPSSMHPEHDSGVEALPTDSPQPTCVQSSPDMPYGVGSDDCRVQL